MIDWQPMETAPTEGPQVLAAVRHSLNCHIVWPAELADRGSTNELYYMAWAAINHPNRKVN